jgi:hypothetical protein
MAGRESSSSVQCLSGDDGPPPEFDDLLDEITALQKTNVVLDSQNQALAEKLRDASTYNQALGHELIGLDEEIGRLEARLSDVNVSVEDIRSETHRLDASAQELKRVLSSTQEIANIAKKVRFLQRSYSAAGDRVHRLRLVLRDPDFLRVKETLALYQEKIHFLYWNNTELFEQIELMSKVGETGDAQVQEQLDHLNKISSLKREWLEMKLHEAGMMDHIRNSQGGSARQHKQYYSINLSDSVLDNGSPKGKLCRIANDSSMEEEEESGVISDQKTRIPAKKAEKRKGSEESDSDEGSDRFFKRNSSEEEDSGRSGGNRESPRVKIHVIGHGKSGSSEEESKGTDNESHLVAFRSESSDVEEEDAPLKLQITVDVKSDGESEEKRDSVDVNVRNEDDGSDSISFGSDAKESDKIREKDEWDDFSDDQNAEIEQVATKKKPKEEEEFSIESEEETIKVEAPKETTKWKASASGNGPWPPFSWSENRQTGEPLQVRVVDMWIRPCLR